MSTLYELFKVTENATQEEIAGAYHKILEKADSLPQNEKIVEQIRRIKIAYGILSNPEKRKKYDLDLATKRADELLQNVQVKNEEPKEEANHLPEEKKLEEMQTQHTQPSVDEAKIKQAISNQINHIVENYHTNEKEKKLAEKQKKRLQKQQKRQAKKDQQLKREMEIQAYGKYLENQGYKVKYPWTWLRVKRLMIAIIAVSISLWILWQIPFIKNSLMELYQENFVIKFFADMIHSVFQGIGNSIKSIFQ